MGKGIRLRKVKDFGSFKEIENYIYAPMYGNHSARGEKSKETAAAVKKVNERKTAEKVEDKIKANFHPKDWYLTLTYLDAYLPKDEAGAIKDMRNFLDRLKRHCKKNGIVLKYLKTTEQGEKRKRWHHHIILPGQIKFEDLENIWGKGSINPKRLWSEGNTDDKKDRLNVHNLAEYFVGVHKKGKTSEDREKHKKRYSFSRNCTEPKVTYEVMAPRWLKNPRIPKGWEMAAGSLEEYKDAYGLLHQKYRIVKKE